MKHGDQYIALDLLRGVAALLVCASHLRNFLFVDFGLVADPTVADKFFYWVTGLGHPAVIVFFVLSGYFVGGSVWEGVRRGEFDWAEYMLARLSRLWVVLIPALLLTLSFDKLGESILHGVGYDGRWESVLSSGPGTGSNSIDFSVQTFLGNVFFLQTMVVPVLGTNGPLWSLANEFWYYLMFPFLALALHKRSTLSLFPVAIIGIFLGWLSFEMLSGFLFWLMGWFASMPDKLPFRVRRWHIFVGTAVFAAALASTKFRGGFIGEMVVAVSAWGLLHILPYAKLDNRLLVRGATGLSDMSYSLYLFHFPFMAFCWFVFIAPNQFQPSALSYGQFLILMAATLIFCFAMWWIFERHTAYVRSVLRDKLGVHR